MNKYLFKLDKDLFDLNAMEMDEGLMHFFHQIEDLPDTFSMVNDASVSRKFSISWEERLLKGRGIKGFFALYDADYLFIERLDDGVIKVSSPPHSKLDGNAMGMPLFNRKQAETVFQAMSSMKHTADKWFYLYQIAQDFQISSNDDQLVCLPYIRDAEIFQYQLKTVKSVLHRFKGRALFCDEVGLGKTVEAGMAMLEYIMRGLAKKILILTPPSLVQQWENEMKRKFNQDFIKADDPAFKSQGADAWASHNKVIASLTTAKRKNHREVILQQHYDLIIVDEAHHLKNRSTEAWKFVNNINKKYIFLLTATPVQNHLEELYNLTTLLKPGQLKTYSYFKKNFVESHDGIEVKNAETLKGLLGDVMIRNKRSNVDVQFTKRKAFTQMIELPVPQQKLYEEISTFIRNQYQEKRPEISHFQLKSLQEQMGSTFTAILGSLHNLLKSEKVSIFNRKN
ncbi:DEAD/DEAH box helicase [Heyndrickxia acidiproducens]|uniref:DEAD/DEAH box helicase n=1 Tax=Heyndrickxia acidiproducens TaxID=1121084 RepID=UPI001F216C7B|nr:DEAD/DEAH box helicase [Heyndrickxia acidiproducens]